MAGHDDAAGLVPGTPWTSHQLRELRSMRTHLGRVRSGTVAPGLALHPDNPMLIERAHQVDELIDVLDRALGLEPDDVDILLIQGEVEHAWRRFTDPEADSPEK
jgi:hypothetical protein